MMIQDYWLLFVGCFAIGMVCAKSRHQSGVALAALVILNLAVGFLSGCTTTVKHEVPQLNTVGEAMKKIVIQDCQKPTLAMPPIPMECVIDIRGDVMAASSQECEDLIRYYSRARSLLKPAAPSNAVQPAH